MNPKEKARSAMERWYDEFIAPDPDGELDTKTIAVALVILQRLKTDFNLDPAAHFTADGTDVRDISPTEVRSVLERIGVTDPAVIETLAKSVEPKVPRHSMQ